jgi:hypothetical protein
VLVAQFRLGEQKLGLHDAASELFDALDQGRPRDAPPLSIADVAVALWPAADATPSEAGERARQVLEARGIALPRTVQ